MGFMPLPYTPPAASKEVNDDGFGKFMFIVGIILGILITLGGFALVEVLL
jgi:hypothetical protein